MSKKILCGLILRWRILGLHWFKEPFINKWVSHVFVHLCVFCTLNAIAKKLNQIDMLNWPQMCTFDMKDFFAPWLWKPLPFKNLIANFLPSQSLSYTFPNAPSPKGFWTLFSIMSSSNVKYLTLELNGNASIVGWYSSSIHLNHFWFCKTK